MPYSVKKVRKGSKSCFRVFNRKTKRVFSKCSTKNNANKQLKLLRAIHYNKNFVANKTRKTY